MGMTPADKFFKTYIENRVKVIKKKADKKEEAPKVEEPEVEVVEEEPVEVPAPPDKYVVTRPTINIRLSADKTSESIDKLHKGDEICIFNENDGWAEVVGGGFVPLNSIKKVEE